MFKDQTLKKTTKALLSPESCPTHQVWDALASALSGARHLVATSGLRMPLHTRSSIAKDTWHHNHWCYLERAMAVSGVFSKVPEENSGRSRKYWGKLFSNYEML